MPKQNISPSRFFPHKERYEIFDGNENLVEKFKISVQDFVPIRTALIVRCFSCPLESVTNHVCTDYNINHHANDHTPFSAKTLFHCYQYVLPSYKELAVKSSQAR